MTDSVTGERWSRVKQLTADALELPASERPSWLAEACAGDEALRREVSSLLKAHAESGQFLETPGIAEHGAALAVAATALRGSTPSLTGRSIGPYRVLRELGHGGMGVVYLGERADAAFEKKVAIKVVRGGFASGPSTTQRFHDERRILATLDHPNIARLLDAGALDDGLPYFVMEYVDGIPLDVHCEALRLSVEQRLRLFLQVCAAVQFAHQRLVIHRDLKARNILVTPEGTPKLLDFGIAKLLEPGLAPEQETRTGMRPLTLESASPEQVRGEPMTVASDVYALGALLYRLLTGQGPYGAGELSEPELILAICELPPARPSTAAPGERRRELRRELDWVVLKALRKEPDRRYSSVEQLADDIGRHLTAQPVLAAPDSWSYRAEKFLARHRTAVAAGVLLACSLGAGLTATLWQARRAEEQRARAERRFNDVRKLANAVVGELHDAIRDLPGSTRARQLLVTHALEYLDGLAREAAGDYGLQLDLAAAYEKVGDVQGQPTWGNLGDYAGARRSYEKALSIRQALSAVDPNELGAQRSLAASYRRIGRLLEVAGAHAEATASFERGHAIASRLAESHAQDAGLAELLAATHCDLAWHLATEAPSRALRHAQQALAISQRLAALLPDQLSAQERLAISLERVGKALEAQTPGSGAGLERLREAGVIWDRLLAPDPANTSVRWSVLANRELVAEALRAKGDTAGALLTYGQTLGMAESLAAGDSHSAEFQAILAAQLVGYGEVQLDAGRPAQAAKSLERAIAILEPLSRDTPANHELRVGLARAQRGLVIAKAAPARPRADARASGGRADAERDREVSLDRRMDDRQYHD